jgi:hypothetical protein
VAQPAERETYRQQLMRVLRLDERELDGARLLLKTPRRTPSRPASAVRGPAAKVGTGAASALESSDAAPDEPETKIVSKLEAFCLGALLREHELLYKADRELQALGLPKLDAGDFAEVEHQLIFAELTAALEQVEMDPADYVRRHIDPALRPRAALLMAEPPAGDASPDRTAEVVLYSVLRLRWRTVSNWLRELRFLAEDAREAGDERAEAYRAEISRQATALAGVDRALARRSKRQMARPQRIGL